MPEYEWLVAGGEVVRGDGVLRADVAVSGGQIAAVEEEIPRGRAAQVVDATGMQVFPGFIDAHNHPYYADDLEGFSLSAAAGGVTTLVPFAGHRTPATGHSDDAVDVVDRFLGDAGQRSYLDFGVHAIVGAQDRPDHAVPALLERGVRSLKVFLAFPGRRMVGDDYALALMEVLAPRGGLCMVHCENGTAIDHLERRLTREGRTGSDAYADSRPAELESEAVARALALAQVAGCDCYIVHLSAARSLDEVAVARAYARSAVYVETCPHYLLLDRHQQAELGALAKISPPMRDRHDVDALWNAVRDGRVDVVASDCSDQTRDGKSGAVSSFFDAPFGIPGVEQLVGLVYDEAQQRRDVALTTLARVLAETPARIFGLCGKGRIEPGADADLVVVDPRLRWTVRTEEQHGRSDYSIYQGRSLVGRPVTSMQRGRLVLRDGTVHVRPGDGRFLPATTEESR